MSVTSRHFQSLENRIRERSAVIGVIGLGYVGLPLVRMFLDGGFTTMGFDIDESKINRLLAGESYIGHIPAERLTLAIQEQRFLPTADMQRLNEPDVILICVPTPLTEARDPDLTFVLDTSRQIAAALRPGQLVVLESTTYPGTTRDAVLPLLNERGLDVESDYFLAYSPERENPGDDLFRTRDIPKVVGGIGPLSQELAAALYGAVVVQVVPVGSAEVAEASKILENVYRAVNIALVNELKMLFDRMGLDVWQVIEAARTKPFGFQAFYPGPGLGGHCIPIDPFYLSWVARKHGLPTRFIELAGEINTHMPAYVISRLAFALNERAKPVRGSRICVLGVAYKPNVDDSRESPAYALIDMLRQQGAEVSYNDPHVPQLSRTREYPHFPALSSSELSAEFLASQDAVLIATNHAAYDFDFIVRYAPLVVDTRNATRDVWSGREKIVKA